MIEAVLQSVARLGETSPIGAALALIVLALVAGLLLVRTFLRAARDAAAEAAKAQAQAALDARADEFQRELMGEIDKLRAREERLLVVNDQLREALGAQRVELALMREQSARLIAALRDVRDGKLAPALIDLPPEAT